MNPIVVVRIEALRAAVQSDTEGPELVARAKEFEKYMRRGLSIASLGAGGCGGCGDKGANSEEAKRKRQQLLSQDVRALIGHEFESMTLTQLLTDIELLLPQNASDRIDAQLSKWQLRREIAGKDLMHWIETGKLPGSKGKAYIP